MASPTTDSPQVTKDPSGKYFTIDNWVNNGQGTEIYTRTWVPEPQASASIVAVVLFVHGLGEHVQRYNNIFPAFAKAGIKVVAFDQRGFGRTGRRSGKLGNSEGLAAVFQDMKNLIASQGIPGVPLFLMGHSMGGGIVLSFSAKYPEGIKGIIASAPFIAPGTTTKPKGIEPFLLKFAPAIIPSFTIKSSVDPKLLCRDSAEVQAYIEDPYVHPWMTLGTTSSLVGMSADLITVHAPKCTLPIFINHGDGDPVTCPIASKKFYDDAPSKDKTYKSLGDRYHEVHNGSPSERDEIISLWVDWILAHL